MTRTLPNMLRLLALALVTLLVLAACSDASEEVAGSDTNSTQAPTAEEPDEPTDGPQTEETEVAQTGAGCESVDLSSPPESPTTIRIGHGVAAEEPFWLMSVMPELTEHQDTWYEMDLQQFRGTEERLQAYQAGELDAVVVSPQAQIRGTAAGALDLVAIGTIMREAEPDAFSTSFVTLEGSDITTTEDLTGNSLGIVDVGSHLDFLARAGVRQGGGDPDLDAQYVVLPFPAQEEALRGGQIDVAGLPEPFFSIAMANGGLVKVFDAADLTDFAYDLLTLSFDRTFTQENLAAVCAWRDDYAAAMEFYRNSNEEARTALAASDFIQLPEQAYLQTGDYARPEGAVVDTEGMQMMLDELVEFGILTEDDRIDPQTLVEPGVSLGH